MSEVKIALVGSAPSSCQLAPYQDPGWRIIGCSPGLYGVAPRVDEWLELHRWEPGAPWFSPEYCQWLKALPQRGARLWTGGVIADLPGSEALPWQEILDEFDPSGWFCSSSLFWMMALAMRQGAKKIGFWGVDMAAGEEYELQRAGIHHMVYIAQKRGIEIGCPQESDLFTPRFKYGIDEWTHNFCKSRVRDMELAAREADAQNRFEAAKQEMAFLRGARDDLKYQRETWPDKSDRTAPRPLTPAFAGPPEREASFTNPVSFGYSGQPATPAIPSVISTVPESPGSIHWVGDQYLDGSVKPEIKGNGSAL